MRLNKFVAGTALAAILAGAVPAAPALADGAASTRNILLGIGAATYLIIQHNRKVHQKYAEDARRQAAAQQQANDAWAAYSSEKRAYDNEHAANVELQKEVAYQHSLIAKQRQQLAMGPRVEKQFITRTVAAQPNHSALQNTADNQQVAMVSYGWGQL
ncbi:MAG: hypothetical protein ACXWNK_16915 [Vulcanimicrobiaceae bacterium]